MRVAFIGLGNIGRPMCERVVGAGFDVAAHDPYAPPVDGARIAASAADAAAGADVACVVVRTDEQAIEAVEGVLRGGLAEGGIVLLHSTVAPSTVTTLVAACDAAGAHLVDAGVSGGPDRAEAGTMVAVVGGADDVLDRCEPVLAAYASDVVRCGPTGSGMAAKLARNLAQYGIWCALFEAMELVDAAGVDLESFATYVRASGLPTNHDVILGRPSVAPITDPAAADRLAWAVAIGDKDLDDAIELARALGVAVPVGEVARHRHARALGADPN